MDDTRNKTAKDAVEPKDVQRDEATEASQKLLADSQRPAADLSKTADSSNNRNSEHKSAGNDSKTGAKTVDSRDEKPSDAKPTGVRAIDAKPGDARTAAKPIETRTKTGDAPDLIDTTLRGGRPTFSIDRNGNNTGFPDFGKKTGDVLSSAGAQAPNERSKIQDLDQRATPERPNEINRVDGWQSGSLKFDSGNNRAVANALIANGESLLPRTLDRTPAHESVEKYFAQKQSGENSINSDLVRELASKSPMGMTFNSSFTKERIDAMAQNSVEKAVRAEYGDKYAEKYAVDTYATKPVAESSKVSLLDQLNSGNIKVGACTTEEAKANGYSMIPNKVTELNKYDAGFSTPNKVTELNKYDAGFSTSSKVSELNRYDANFPTPNKISELNRMDAVNNAFHSDTKFAESVKLAGAESLNRIDYKSIERAAKDFEPNTTRNSVQETFSKMSAADFERKGSDFSRVMNEAMTKEAYRNEAGGGSTRLAESGRAVDFGREKPEGFRPESGAPGGDRNSLASVENKVVSADRGDSSRQGSGAESNRTVSENRTVPDSRSFSESKSNSNELIPSSRTIDLPQRSSTTIESSADSGRTKAENVNSAQPVREQVAPAASEKSGILSTQAQKSDGAQTVAAQSASLARQSTGLDGEVSQQALRSLVPGADRLSSANVGTTGGDRVSADGKTLTSSDRSASFSPNGMAVVDRPISLSNLSQLVGERGERTTATPANGLTGISDRVPGLLVSGDKAITNILTSAGQDRAVLIGSNIESAAGKFVARADEIAASQAGRKDAGAILNGVGERSPHSADALSGIIRGQNGIDAINGSGRVNAEGQISGKGEFVIGGKLTGDKSADGVMIDALTGKVISARPGDMVVSNGTTKAGENPVNGLTSELRIGEFEDGVDENGLPVRRVRDFIGSNNKRYLTGVELTIAAVIAMGGAAKVRSELQLVDPELAGEGSEGSKLQADTNKVLHRRSHMVAAGETLQSIAESLYQNPLVGWLIADLNATNIKEDFIDGRRIVELKTRQQLELPEPEEVTQFMVNLRKDFQIDTLVTIISENTIDHELLNNFLGTVTGQTSTALAPAAAAIDNGELIPLPELAIELGEDLPAGAGIASIVKDLSSKVGRLVKRPEERKLRTV